MAQQLEEPPAPATIASEPHAAAPSCCGGTKLMWIVGLIALIVTIPAALMIWNNGVRRYFIPTKFAVVEPDRLYRSGQISQNLIKSTLVKHHIGLIIDLSFENTTDSRAERATAAELGISRINLFLGGSGIGDPDVYPKAIAAIVDANKKGEPVLVHCQSGSQRTGGVIATYRMLMQGKSEQEAFSEAQQYGYHPSENPRLQPFVEQHLSEWRSKLAEQHVLPGS